MKLLVTIVTFGAPATGVPAVTNARPSDNVIDLTLVPSVVISPTEAPADGLETTCAVPLRKQTTLIPATCRNCPPPEVEIEQDRSKIDFSWLGVTPVIATKVFPNGSRSKVFPRVISPTLPFTGNVIAGFCLIPPPF